MKKLNSETTGRKRRIFFLKLALTGVLLWIIITRTDASGMFASAQLSKLAQSFVLQSWVIPVLIALSLLNWLSDTRVWYKIVSGVKNISFGKVLRANLISQYIGLVTPFSIGEYSAKMSLFETTAEKKQSLLITLSYRLSKSVVKLILGAVALTYLILEYVSLQTGVFVVFIVVLFLIVTMLILFSERLFRWMLQRGFFSGGEMELPLESQHLKIYKTFLPALVKFLAYCVQFALIIGVLDSFHAFTEALTLAILIYSIDPCFRN